MQIVKEETCVASAYNIIDIYFRFVHFNTKLWYNSHWHDFIFQLLL